MFWRKKRYNAEAYRGKGAVLHVLGRHQEALTALEQAMRLNPNDAETRAMYSIASEATRRLTTSSSFLPESLARLGFTESVINTKHVIIPPLCIVPAGPFIMGSSAEPRSIVHPQHQITLPTFQIGKFPVTVAEYACAVRAGAVPEPKGISFFGKVGFTWQVQLMQLDHPVVCISWEDAISYASWLTDLTEEQWKLPTEAEWEKAARGSEGRIYPWGNEWDPTCANTWESRKKSLTPVGSYPGGASPYGVQDMAGNVLEWCSSIFLPYPYDPNDGREEITNPRNRVARGGSFLDGSKEVRTFHRDYNKQAHVSIGMRLVRSTSTALYTWHFEHGLAVELRRSRLDDKSEEKLYKVRSYRKHR
jgi:toxoflavin biosynthesis protein ToxD